MEIVQFFSESSQKLMPPITHVFLVPSFLSMVVQCFTHCFLLYRLQLYMQQQQILKCKDLAILDLSLFPPTPGRAALLLHKLTRGLSSLSLCCFTWTQLSSAFQHAERERRVQGQQFPFRQVKHKLHTLIPLTFHWWAFSNKALPCGQETTEKCSFEWDRLVS